MLSARNRATGILIAASAVVGGSLASSAPASGATTYISEPTVQILTAAENTLSIAAHAVHATHYKMWASTTKSAVYNSALGNGKAIETTGTGDLTLRGLPYSSKPYWFRVEGLNGSHHRLSEIFETGVQPAVPSHVAGHASNGQSFLTWNANAAGEVIEQATDPTFTTNAKYDWVRGAGSQFTPVDVPAGRTNYYRVAGDNYGVSSAWSQPVALRQAGGVASITVMTYNILEASMDGHSEGGQRVPSWSKRKSAAVSLIRRAAPNVIAVQEGSPFIGKHHTRQAADLAHALGYTLAHTEITYRHPHWFRTGDYILYNKSVLKAVGHGNHWSLGGGKIDRFAAYQVLEDRATHAKFLFVAPHLMVGAGSHWDALRQHQTQVLLKKAKAHDAKVGNLPIVYAGDFNSHAPSPDIAFDGPARAMKAAHVADSIQVANSESNTKYNSANQYLRKAPKTHLSIDHVYVSGGIGVSNWTQLLNLSHGRFVGTMPSDHNPVVARLAIPF
jgi:endonuclease/exonuclease/phosphatase family metal-dependent hydrolase